MKKAKYESRPVFPAVLAMLAMAAVSTACAVLTTAIIPAHGWHYDAETAYSISGWRLLEMVLDNYVRGLPLGHLNDRLRSAYDLRLLAIVLSTMFGAITGFRIVHAATPLVDNREHHDGKQLLIGNEAIAETQKAMNERKGRGERPVELAPDIPFPRLWRVLNLLIVGAIGSGKTRIVLWLIDQFLAELKLYPRRDNALLVYDTTGEILAGMPLENHEFVTVHPHRPGGYGWAMGRDFTTIEDMEEAADQGVQSTNEAMWGKGAAAICAGCMLTAYGRRGAEWGMPEFYAAAMMPPREMKAMFKRHYPVAGELIEFDASGDLSKTSLGMLLTFRASVLRVLRPLAEAWRDMPKERLFSFREWVEQSNPSQPKTVVLQRSGRHPTMSAFWIGMALDSIVSHVSDGAFPVSQSRTRTLVLDELPTLGRLAKLPELLDTGRNKGICTVASVQDMNQLHVYGPAEKSLKMRFRLKIFGAQTPGPELKEIAEGLGTRRVTDTSYDTTVTTGPQGRTEQVAENKRIDTIPTVSEDYLAHELGVRRNRVRAILVGLKEVARVEWPVTIWNKRR